MGEEKFAAATAAPGLHGWVVSDTSSVSAVKKKKSGVGGTKSVQRLPPAFCS